MANTKSSKSDVVITPPSFSFMALTLVGVAPLVVERFSKKAEIMEKMAEGQKAKNKRTREARDYEKEAEEARYRSTEGWEGMNAAAYRTAMIDACRLVGFKMTLAKLTLFVVPDGFDQADGIPLVRIYGESHTYSARARNASGVIDVRVRPMYREWAARINIKFDQQQFSATDVVNLIARVGEQVGVGAGRPNSRMSAGCGWGLFRIAEEKELKAIHKKFGIA